MFTWSTQKKGKDVRARRTYIAYQHDAHIYNSAPRSCKSLLKWYRRISLHKHVTSRTGVIVLRFSGAQRRTRGGHEVQVTQFALQTSHFAIALCLPPFDWNKQDFSICSAGDNYSAASCQSWVSLSIHLNFQKYVMIKTVIIIDSN